jgi:putative SOS response-associated peptidase YedK
MKWHSNKPAFPARNADRLQKLLAPYPAKEMSSHAVSTSVNIPDADSAELIKPLNNL